jgi:flagellar hook-associated protein 2
VAAPASDAATGTSLLSVGTVSATDVSTGNGSLGDVVTNINNANAGLTATSVQTGTNEYVLQLSSGSTGTSGDLSVDTGSFSSSPLGSLQVATAGADAQIQIGGSSGYVLNSQTNTFTGLLPGLSVTALQQSDNAVTVTTSPDASAVSEQVQAMVDDANEVLADINTYGGYNASTKTAGPLMGSAALQTITNEVQGIIAGVEGTSTLGNGESVGLTLDNGKIDFNASTFETAFNSNPTQVANMFTQGGTFQSSSSQYTGDVTLNSATNNTHAGSYAVSVTQSAEQAVANGNELSGGTVSTAEQLTIAQGTNSVGYATTAGESLQDIATGINAALAGAGMTLSAQVVDSGTKLQIASSDYGSGATFSVTSNETGSGTTGLGGSTAGTEASYTGTDVAGSINGVTATGTGQYLNAPSSDPTLAGLSLEVTTPGITSATNVGNFSYQPGIAQQLSTLGTQMSDPTTGNLSTTIQDITNQENGLTSQVSFYAEIVAQQQTMLTNQYANLQAQLSTLEDQSTALTSQINGLAANSPSANSSSSG